MISFETFNKAMADLDTFKLFGINSLVFLSTLTSIDTVLKLILLLVSIVYTVVKILAVVKRDLKNGEDKKQD